MENNIESIVKIINQIGNFEIIFDANLNEFLFNTNVEINSSKYKLDSMMYELDSLMLNQVDLKIDDKMFQNLISIVNSLINNLKSSYNHLRVFYDFDDTPTDVVRQIEIIDYKISKLLELKSKFEFGEKFSENLGQIKQIKTVVPENTLSKYKVATRFKLIEELGIKNIITILNCSQGDKHKILSIIMGIHIDTAKELINDSYKWSGSDEEKKIIEDILKKIK